MEAKTFTITNKLKKGNAIFSPCRKYRYALWRIWDEKKPIAMFIGLNPSKANEKENDPTINRCISFAKSWNFGGLYMTNLFAYCTSSPSIIKSIHDPIGKDNDMWLKIIQKKTSIIMVAWGNQGRYLNRSKKIIKLFSKLKCIKKNRTGEPSHPLYLKSNLKPKNYL